jgi:hypothetical protein
LARPTEKYRTVEKTGVLDSPSNPKIATKNPADAATSDGAIGYRHKVRSYQNMSDATSREPIVSRFVRQYREARKADRLYVTELMFTPRQVAEGDPRYAAAGYLGSHLVYLSDRVGTYFDALEHCEALSNLVPASDWGGCA